MGLIASSILVKYSLLNSSGSLVYAGSSSNSLRLWGAQLELAEYSEQILDDFINHFRYTRTTGIEANFISTRLGYGYEPDTILIGGGSGTRWGNGNLENTALYINKYSQRGVDTGTLFTFSTSITTVITSSYTISSTSNLLPNSEQFDNWTQYGSTAITPNIIASPDGNQTADAVFFPNTTFSGFYQNVTAGVGTYTFSVWLKSDTTTSVSLVSDTNLSETFSTSVTVTNNWQQYVFTRQVIKAGTNTINLQVTNYTFTPYTSWPLKVHAWGAQMLTSTALLAIIPPTYVRTTSAALINVPVSSTANLLLNSENFSYTTLTWSNSMLTLKGYADPLGGNNATYVYDGDYTGDNQQLNQIITIPTSSSNVYSISLYIKQPPNTSTATTYMDLYSFYVGGTTRGASLRYNFVTDTVTVGNGDYVGSTSPEGGALPFNYGRTLLPNGWVRIYFNSYDNIGNNNNLYYRIYAASRDRNTVGSLLIYGAQVTLANGPNLLAPGNIQYVSSVASTVAYAASTGIVVSVTSLNTVVSSYSITSFTLTTSILTDVLTGTDYDRVYTGQAEKLTFNTKFNLRDTEAIRTDLRNIPSAPKYDAQAIMGINVARKTAVIFDLNQYQPLTGDNIYYNALDWFSEAPRSRRARKSVGAETLAQFFDKHLDETKFIPRVKKIDALRVMGLEPINKTSSTVDLAKYTPLRSSDVTYYKRYDWYSLTPRSQYAKLAYGIGDGSPYITDNMQFIADGLLYSQTKAFYETLLISSPGLDGRLAGAPLENISFVELKVASKGVQTDIAIDNTQVKDANSNLIVDSRYTGKTWYKLAPYYATYSHIIDTAAGADNVRVGQYYAGNRWSQSQQEMMSYVFIKGTIYDPVTMIDNMMILGENITFAETKAFNEGVGVGTPLSSLSPYVKSFYTADQTQELFYNKPGNPYGRNWYQLAPVPSYYQSLYAKRTSGNKLENISFTWLLTAHRAGSANTVRIPVTAPTKTQQAGQLNETFYNQPNNKFAKRWYQLAPYYNQNIWLIDTPTDPFDIVRIGSPSPVKTSNPYETIAFLFIPPVRYETSTVTEAKANLLNLALAETKAIPQVAKYDAAHVSELFFNTVNYIDGKKYTPLDGNYTYYKKTEWYNLAPRFSRPRFALGPNGGTGPQMLDNMQLSDGLTYYGGTVLRDTFLVGGDTGFRYQSSQSSLETTKFFVNRAAKRGAYREITIDNRPFTSSDAATIMDAFVNRTNRSWFQLTPYYSDSRYSRIRDGEGGVDNVRVGGYWAGIRVSSSDQEKLSITHVQGTRTDRATGLDALTKYDTRIARAGAATPQTVVRTNRLNYSETISNSWTTTGVTLISSLVTLSPSLAYRTVVYDADQLADVLVSTKNNYYGRRWYTIVPLATRTAFSSSGIAVVIPTSSNAQHAISTSVQSTDGIDNWFSLGMYVNTSGGITKVRLEADGTSINNLNFDLSSGSNAYDLVNNISLPFANDLADSFLSNIPHYADFDLSSQTVINRVNVNYAAVVPQGNNWYLVKIMGPVLGNMSSSYDARAISDSISITDTYDISSNLFDNFIPTDLNV
jgi:hypothetical protein